MNFFTPDLLVRYGSTDDAVADAAHQEWEKVHQDYLEHLRVIRPKLPRAVKSFFRNFCLHDAKLLTLGIREGGLALSLLLELDTPSDKGVLLTYALTKRPQLIRHPLLSEQGTPIDWLYDEFDIAKEKAPRVFTHSILFTGGRELRLTFRNLH